MGNKKFYETAAFKKTQAEWYARLKSEKFTDEERILAKDSFGNVSEVVRVVDSPFEDIETSGSEYVIEKQKFTPSKIQSTGGMDYYQYCQTILDCHDFPPTMKGDLHRTIFELHTEGRSVREIEEYLKKTDHKKLKYVQIYRIIDSIKQDFGGG